MAITLRMKIGGSEIAVAGKDLKEIIEQASIFYELPQECGLCQCKHLGFRHRRTDDYDFFEQVCLECGATYSLGQKKEGGGLFPRGNKDTGEWEPKYEKKSDQRRDDRRDDRRDSRQDDRRDTRREDRQPTNRRGTAPDDQDDVPFSDRTSRTP